MARDTSVKAYNEIKKSGLLRGRQLQVYETLYHHGPMTAAEVYHHLRKQGVKVIQPSITPRIAPLQRKGVIKEVGKKKCPITGRTVYLLDVTSKVPDGTESGPKKSTCAWTQGGDGQWDSECNNSFEFSDGNPNDNSFVYCPYCGRVLTMGDMERRGKEFFK